MPWFVLITTPQLPALSDDSRHAPHAALPACHALHWALEAVLWVQQLASKSLICCAVQTVCVLGGAHVSKLVSMLDAGWHTGCTASCVVASWVDHAPRFSQSFVEP